MADQNKFPKAEGDILFASEVNGIRGAVFNNLIYDGSTVLINAILAHSATDWTLIKGTDTLVTSDSGVTFVAATTDNAAMTGVSKDFGAKGISCDHDSNVVFFTINSGVDWTVSSTPIDANATRVFDASFGSSTVVVAGLDVGTAASGIVYSTDAGDTWNDSDFPVADCVAISMVDGSDGIAIHTDNSIFTTSNGGVNWTDSTQALTSGGVSTSIIALTSTTGVKITRSATATIETFTTGAGGTTRLIIPDADEDVAFSNLIKTTNGNIYFIRYLFEAGSAGSLGMDLFRSNDSGVTWSQRALGNSSFESRTDIITNETKSHLVEYDTNKLLFLVGVNQLMIIDESWNGDT